jgi:hypothetical protein
MTNAVVDNSTLSAVERVLGHIPIDGHYDLSGDLSAFEAYLSSLLFYDQPVRIDDYKAEFASARAQHFPEIGAVQFEPGSYETLLQQARKLASGIFLRIHGGDLGDDILGRFLKDLDLHVCPAWHMQSSDFYLRIRLLADESGTSIEKYSPLMSAIFSQLNENKSAGQKPNWNKELIASTGEVIRNREGKSNERSYRIGSDIHAFSAGLNWLALRSVFYALVSEHLEAAAICHPIRNDFLAEFYMSHLGDHRPDQRDAVLSYFRATAEEIVNRSNEILGGGAFKLQTPLISAWATVVAGSPTKARDHILQTRYSPEAIALRARMRDIEALHQAEDIGSARAKAATLFRDFNNSVSGFFQKFGAKGEDPLGISANVISMSGSFKVIPALQKLGSLLPARAKSVSLLRNITLDLLQSPRLGRVSDMLRADAQIGSNEIESVYWPKVEKPSFVIPALTGKSPCDERNKGIARVTFFPGKTEGWKRLTEQAMEIVRTRDSGTLQ